jgi:hypothetical protein
MKARKPIPARVKALLQQEVNSACPFCSSSEVDHFHVHHIDENPANNDFSNLLMMCTTCHSKVTKGDIPEYDVRRKKMFAHNRLPANVTPPPARRAIFFESVNNSVVGDNNRVTFKVENKPKNKYPPGCIGYDFLKANYIGYRIGRYNEFKGWEMGKQGMNYAIFNSILKKQFKMGPTRTIYNLPIERFEELSRFIQHRIDGTKLVRMKTARGETKFYSSFDEYLTQQTTA